MTTMIQTVGLDSATLSAASYDEGASQLQLDFRDGTRYTYSGVGSELFREFISAPSKGAFFNRIIRGRFAYVKLAAEN